jgi:serine/threonine protein kinase
LLATYEQNDEYFLLFYWADTDLWSYWFKLNPQPQSDKRTILWLARECAGIASGLARIHGPHNPEMAKLAHYSSFKNDMDMEMGMNTNTNKTKPQHSSITTRTPIHLLHGDIKAPNALLFPSTGASLPPEQRDPEDWTIRISDFGLAGLSSIRTNASVISNTPTYAPPEWETGNTIYGNSGDIWALGCLYLEFITWFFGGEMLLREFARARAADKGYSKSARNNNNKGEGGDRFYMTKTSGSTATGNRMITAEVKQSVTKVTISRPLLLLLLPPLLPLHPNSPFQKKHRD